MAMGSLRYWMMFQVVLGIWLIISPFALGFRDVTSMTVNDLILGAIVTILGLAVALTGLPRIRHFAKST
jgi:hypothetical protein